METPKRSALRTTCLSEDSIINNYASSATEYAEGLRAIEAEKQAATERANRNRLRRASPRHHYIHHNNPDLFPE